MHQSDLTVHNYIKMYSEQKIIVIKLKIWNEKQIVHSLLVRVMRIDVQLSV